MILGHFYQTDYLKHILRCSNSKLIQFSSGEYHLNFFVIEVQKGLYSVNSSPFYGSHGGIYFDPLFKKVNSKDANLVPCDENFEEAINFLSNNSILSLNIIENPFATKIEKLKNDEFLDRIKNLNLFSEDIIFRKGFVKHIKSTENPDNIISTYHQKTRNCVRKFLKTENNIKFITVDDQKNWLSNIEELSINHKISIEAKGGIFKRKDYFLELNKYFSPDRLFAIRVEDVSEKKILLATCLFFKIKNTIEFWTPVVTEKGKEINALHGLIDFTFKYMSNNNIEYLNFGGTWPEQIDLQRFKSRFGSVDFEYKYYNYTKANLKNNFEISNLIKKNPHFFFWKK